MKALTTTIPLTSTGSRGDSSTVEVTVDAGLLHNLLKRSGRVLARPALEAMEMVLEPTTPHRARVTVLAALPYLLVPIDLIPDGLPRPVSVTIWWLSPLCLGCAGITSHPTSGSELSADWSGGFHDQIHDGLVSRAGG